MKWLIFSTIGKNPGDEFIRVGTEYLVRKIDPDATIEVLDKETNDIHKNTPFDKCIWAGMPVFWSLYSNNNWSINWWKHMTGQWPSMNKNNFCIIGAGSFQDWANVYRAADIDGLIASAKKLKDSSFAVVARDPIVNHMCRSNFKTLICPAIFSCQDRPKTKSIKACNLMPGGAHYSNFNEAESSKWDSIQKKISDILIQNNFIFFAHSPTEYAFAKYLGWNDGSIINYSGGKPELMLNEYRNVDKYFGNRVHGCIVSRGNGADVISCGYDSRQEAVRLSGAKCFLPSEIDLLKFAEWAERDIVIDTPDLNSLENEYLNILKKFKEHV
jgi:hypothetical protein